MVLLMAPVRGLLMLQVPHSIYRKVSKAVSKAVRQSVRQTVNAASAAFDLPKSSQSVSN